MRVERKRGSWGRGTRNTSRHECVRIGKRIEVSCLSVSHTYDVGSHTEAKKVLSCLVLINEVIGRLQRCLGWYCTRL